MTPDEAYAHVYGLLQENAPLVLEQRDLNALAMHPRARVHRFDVTPPVVEEVMVQFEDSEWDYVVRRVAPPAQPVAFEHRGLDCSKHGLAAHRRERLASGPWTCIECAPLPSEGT